MLSYGITEVDGQARALVCDGWAPLRALIDEGHRVRFRAFRSRAKARGHAMSSTGARSCGSVGRAPRRKPSPAPSSAPVRVTRVGRRASAATSTGIPADVSGQANTRAAGRRARGRKGIPVVVDGTWHASASLAAASMGASQPGLSRALRDGNATFKGHQVAYGEEREAR